MKTFYKKVLAYCNEAVLPFYIFHQTIILCVGWFVIRWNIGILPKFLIIAVASFALIMILYESLVRRFSVLRFFFGMRPKKNLSETLAYQRENRRDLLFAFGVGKKISEKASVNAFYVPFIKDFTYSESIVRSPGYYEKNTGSVDVENIFLIEFKYNFGHGKKIRKIERTIEHEEDAEGGAL